METNGHVDRSSQRTFTGEPTVWACPAPIPQGNLVVAAGRARDDEINIPIRFFHTLDADLP